MLRVETNQHTTTLTLNRPEMRNALNRSLARDIRDAVRNAANDPLCRCLVITGAGEHFAAGRDLAEAGGKIPPIEEIMENDDVWVETFRLLRGMSIPSVAVVRGYAVAGGFTLSMGCDFVLADKSARFGALEMRGGFCAAVNTALLTHLLPPRQALELLISDQMFDAQHLYRIGLVTKLAEDPSELEAIAKEFVAGLVRLEPESIRLTKDIHRATLDGGLEAGLTLGSHVNSLMMSSGRFARAHQRFQDRE